MRFIALLLFPVALAGQSFQLSGGGDGLSHPVVTAAARGDVVMLKAALAKGWNANATQADGKSVLYGAVFRNQVEIAEALIDAGASGINDLQDLGKDRSHFLGIAAWLDNPGMVRMLLKHGADASALESDGRDALAGGIAKGNAEIVKLLLEAGADPNRRWPEGYNAMFQAAVHGQVEVLQMLLDHNGKADSRDDHGTTALMVAAQMGKVEAAQLLLGRKAPVYPLDAWGRSALYYAKNSKDSSAGVRIAALLRAAGADDREKPRPIDSAYLRAAYHGNLELARELLSKGADLNARGIFDGELALSDALSASVHHPQVFRFLIDQGINPFAKTSYDFTVLHSAAADGAPEVIELLGKMGLNPNARSKTSEVIPLYSAINGVHKPLNVVALLKIGADPNLSAHAGGETLLDFADSKHYAQIVKILRDAGERE